jgi:hypothetical protein
MDTDEAKRMRIVTALGSLLAAVVLVFGVQVGETVFADSEGGYTIKLPDGWIPTRGEAAQDLVGLRARLEPAVPFHETPVVFLKAEQGNISSSFPKIVVHVQRESEVGYKQFQAIHAFKGAVEKTVARALGFRDEQGVMRDASYDTNRNALSFSFPCQNGDVLGVGYSFLTSHGLINIYCYAPTEEFDRWRGEFGTIARGVQIAADHQPTVSNAPPKLIESIDDWKFVGFAVVVLALLALKALGRIPWLERDLRSDEL